LKLDRAAVNLERTQLDIEIFSAGPPPNRKTDQRALKTQLVIVTNLQLPKRADASF
jgi:hypothetical protein